MADKNFEIWATLKVDDKQIKTEFTKAWELAGQSVADWLEKKWGDIEQRMSEQIDNLRWKLEDLSNFDWDLNINTENAQDYIDLLWDEITDANRKLFDFKDELESTWEDGWEAFSKLQSETQDFASTLVEARGLLKEYADNSKTWFDDLKDSVDKTTEAVQKLNDTAEKWASENRWIWKLIKFLWSARVMNFFYNQIKNIWAKLIELSGDWEKLATKWWEVQSKFETLWGYLGKWLTPVLESTIDDIGDMSDGLLWAGQNGENMAKKFAKAGNVVWNIIRWLIKLVKSFGIFFGSVLGWLVPIVEWFFTDMYENAKSVITWIGNVDNWKALGNNIKYWVVSWVNGAIESLNWMLDWIKENLKIDLWRVDTFDAGKEQSYNFGDLTLSRTKDAVEAWQWTMEDAMNDVWKDWYEFIKDIKNWWKDIDNTTLTASKDVKKKVEEVLWTGRGGWSKKDSVKWAFEELEEVAVDVWDEMSSLVEDHQKSYDKLIDEIDKVSQEYDKLREEAKKTWEEAEKSLESYNNELSKAQWEAITELGQRYVELQKELMWVDGYMKQLAEQLSWKEIRTYQEWWNTKYRWYDLKELIELKEKLDEMRLIEENTTTEQRKSEEFLKETSKTQEILNKLKEQETELEEKKASAMEKQAIAQAMINQEEWQQFIKTLTKNGEEYGTYYYDTINKTWEKIHNTDNIEYAKQLEDQTQNLNDQLEQYKQEKNQEVEILIDTTARKIELENEFQAVFEKNAKKQEKELENIISLTDKLIAKKREYLSMWSTLHNAYWWSVMSWVASIVWENGPEQIIARQSSYVQPRNAWNSYNTVNNSNNLSINGLELGKFNTVDDMLDALKERLTYRS